MGFARKVKRRNMPKVHCCGRKMTRKMGYDTETHDFYFCENCGKEKWVERPNCGADMRGAEDGQE